MAENGKVDGAGGTSGADGRLYAYRVRGAGRSGVVLWAGGRGDEPDRVLTAAEGGRCRVPVFVTVRQARAYARRRGWGPAVSGAGTLELVRVQRWLADPLRRRVPAGTVLEAWNFFEDLARGLGAAHRLPRQGAVHDSAYEKLFAGGGADWTPDERRAVLELVAAGVDLWDSSS
ncbi:hypothetical protein Shyhy01_54650 [Streptomyces hygroscopicus subsp. hygroscopicus]|nr:hypothetical protein [Streptomyces hygroscopicus]GLX52515.1 hypothetical protein Shyhy01_54650 [Streptomyces hygroscopicus subsp. hygroscopicus]